MPRYFYCYMQENSYSCIGIVLELSQEYYLWLKIMGENPPINLHELNDLTKNKKISIIHWQSEPFDSKHLIQSNMAVKLSGVCKRKDMILTGNMDLFWEGFLA